MKKILAAMGILSLSLLLLAGCNNGSESAPSEENPVSNNLSESKGDNEVQGTYKSSSTGASVTFAESSATIYSDSAPSGNVLAREATETPQAKYNYSFDSETKTLELQLENLWDTNGAAIAYKTQVESVKSACENICSAIKSQLDSNESFSSFISSLNQLKAGYGDSVKTLLKTKLDDYIAKQQENLETYLKSKYNSVIKLGYELNEGTLSLSQKFLNDLTDASSEFKSSDSYNVILNGYDSLKPFSISLDGTEFVGIPTFASDTEMQVDLYQFLGDVISENPSAIASEKAGSLIEYITGKFVGLTNEEKISLGLEAMSGKTDTIGKWIDDELSALTLKTRVQVSTSGSPILTLTITDDFTDNVTGKTIAGGTSLVLNYSPVLSRSINVNDLVKQ